MKLILFILSITVMMNQDHAFAHHGYIHNGFEGYKSSGSDVMLFLVLAGLTSRMSSGGWSSPVESL